MHLGLPQVPSAGLGRWPGGASTVAASGPSCAKPRQPAPPPGQPTWPAAAIISPTSADSGVGHGEDEPDYAITGATARGFAPAAPPPRLFVADLCISGNRNMIARAAWRACCCWPVHAAGRKTCRNSGRCPGGGTGRPSLPSRRARHLRYIAVRKRHIGDTQALFGRASARSLTGSALIGNNNTSASPRSRDQCRPLRGLSRHDRRCHHAHAGPVRGPLEHERPDRDQHLRPGGADPRGAAGPLAYVTIARTTGAAGTLLRFDQPHRRLLGRNANYPYRGGRRIWRQQGLRPSILPRDRGQRRSARLGAPSASPRSAAGHG